MLGPQRRATSQKPPDSPRQCNLALPDQRQSSITRPTSGQAGKYSVGSPATSITNRPRLKAMPSNTGSRGAKARVSCGVAFASGVAVKARVAVLVVIVSGSGPGAEPARCNTICPAARSQRKLASAAPDSEPNRVTDPAVPGS